MPAPTPSSLLAIDIGLRLGLALYGADGRLRWYRSHNLGQPQRLKRAVERWLREIPGVAVVVIEGGGELAEIWRRTVERRGLRLLQTQAEVWRRELLLPREQRDARTAKASALRLSRTVIADAGLPRPTALRHDAAEAILVGFWACRQLGWRDDDLR